MKQILLFTLLAFLFTAPAFAQVNVLDISPELEKKCTRVTQAMAQELRLNEPAYISLKISNRKLMAKTAELQQTYSDNQNLLHEKMQETELAYEQEIASFLTPTQLKAYAEYKKRVPVTSFVTAKSTE